MPLSRSTIGLICCAGAALLWAVSGVCGKVLLTGSLSPGRLVFYRSLLGALLLLAILLWHDRTLLQLQIRQLPFLIILGMGGLALTQFTYYAAIQSLNVGRAILLQYLAPLWIALFEWLWWRMPLNRRKILALALALMGCALISLGADVSSHWGARGALIGIASGVCFAAYGLMTKHALKTHREPTVLFYSLLFSSVFWGLLGPESWLPWRQIETFKLWMIAYVVVLGTIVPYMLFIHAMRHLAASHASIVATLEPVAAALIAWGVLGETLTRSQLVGGGCVIIAISHLQAGNLNLEG